MFRKNSESEKIYGKELGRGEYRKFPSIIFCLKMPKNFVGESFSLSLSSGIEKINASEDYVMIFRRIVFVSQYRNIPQRNPPLQSFRKFLVAIKFVQKKKEGGLLEISVENVLSGSAEIFRRGLF